MNTLHIRQGAPQDGKFPIRLTLKRAGQPDREGEASIEFALTAREQEDIRWYLEDYLEKAEVAVAVTVEQIEDGMKSRGEELYTKVLAANGDTQAVWFAIRDSLADLRVEIVSGVAEAAAIPWELMRDPKMDSAISLRVKAFVRVQSNPNIGFVDVPPLKDGRLRLLYIACRPSGAQDVELRAVANRLVQDLGGDRARFDIKALRPPTFEKLQEELADAKLAGNPYHIVHFDGHGMYADLRETKLSEWLAMLSSLTLGGGKGGKHGYLLFEHSSEDKMRPVDGQTLGQLLHDNGVPVLVLNACQSAMHEATKAPAEGQDVHDEVRAIGSLAQAVVDQGIRAVLGMRYSVYVVTAAQYIGELYKALAKGRGFGEAATEGRKHLKSNPERWVGLQPRPLQDWFVPVVYEAAPIEFFAGKSAPPIGVGLELDPVQSNRALLRHVPEEGFIGRDETLLALDRAFDAHRVVLLHAYAGQGKSSTAVEFARWYSLTGGLGTPPVVLLASFENYTDLDDLLSQAGQPFSRMLSTQGIEWMAINETEKRRELVMQILRQIPVLWIWDNVEPVAGFPDGTKSTWSAAEQNDLREFLQQIKEDKASKVKILLTSRRNEEKWLGRLPHRISMRRMSPANAARLALKLGNEKGVKRAEIGEWQPLLSYCAGNPLTLRMLLGQAVKAGVRGSERIVEFVEAIRNGERLIEDADEKQGRDKSLGASLDYGFRHAFSEDELPIVALLHLFQGTVDVDVLYIMGKLGEHALPELNGRSKENLIGLLDRAKETGLLSHVVATWYTIHPALPWFLRQIFARHYDGGVGRSSAKAALRGWVEAVGAWCGFYFGQSVGGNRGALEFLALEEANLLHARRLARRNQWWSLVVTCMQGLRGLYNAHGRTAEWARLVEEIRRDYLTEADEPIPGLEEWYPFVIEYRVDLALRHELDLIRAAALQEKSVEHHRRDTALLVVQTIETPLTARESNQLRTLAASIEMLGRIQKDQEKSSCGQNFLEAIGIFRRIEDRQAEATAEYNLGHACKDIPELRDLDAAEAAYQRSQELRHPNDVLGRCRCIKQIGMVHFARLEKARDRKESPETLLRYAQAAEDHYLEALKLCPKEAWSDLAPIHSETGTLYSELGLFEKAREHYETSAHCFERTDDHFGAGQIRHNMALMYLLLAEQQENPSEARSSLRRGRAYAEGALRDYQHYEGRVAHDEADTLALIGAIDEALAELAK